MRAGRLFIIEPAAGQRILLKNKKIPGAAAADSRQNQRGQGAFLYTGRGDPDGRHPGTLPPPVKKLNIRETHTGKG